MQALGTIDGGVLLCWCDREADPTGVRVLLSLVGWVGVPQFSGVLSTDRGVSCYNH